MAKLWSGRTGGITAQAADDFNASIRFDSRMFRQDIRGSMAHAAMLGARGILSDGDTDALLSGLEGILRDLESGALSVDPAAEDIHMFVEQELTKRIGEAGKKLHTARSRNDQVALDLRLYLREECDTITALLADAIFAFLRQAEQHSDTIMPGYTHLQRAQPITFGHHLTAYVMMLLRDMQRLRDCRGRINQSPIGCCALAGTTYPTDRVFEAKQLGFSSVAQNSIDGVSDRDFCAELLSCLSILMVHLSRFSEELILWCSWEFRFVELSDAYCTGSSIMPQKKNPDMAELIRGKTGRVFGDLTATLTMLKGLPLAYNKDMQEDKELTFDAIRTVENCLELFTGMLATMKFKKDTMERSAVKGFTNATDAADYLVNHGVPFRDAHGIIGRLVLYCIDKNKSIDELDIDELRTFSDKFEPDVYDAISLKTCVEKRLTFGAPGPSMMKDVIALNRKYLEEA